MKVFTRPSFDRALKALDQQLQESILATARLLPDAIGKPHQHSGIGIRRVGKFLEFRVGLKTRVLFILEGDDIVLVTLGNHDEIARFVRKEG